MIRKTAYIGLFWFIGLFAASFLTFRMCFAVSAAAAIAAAAAALFLRKEIKYAVCLFSFAAAIFVYGAYGIFVYGNIIKYDGTEVEVKGVITGYADHSGDKASYTIKGVINGDVKATVTCYADSISANVGDRISIIGKAAAFRDSFSFPAESYYKAKNIFLRINSIKALNYSEERKFSLIKIFDRCREHIVGVINSIMDDRGQAVMAAMLFGDKSDLESNDKTLMCRAGIGHIMAVSGVHLAVVCSLFSYIFGAVFRNRYLRFAVMLVPIVCFSLLAGMSVSVIRSAIMIVIVYGSGMFRRRADTFSSLGTAVLLLTIGSPFSIRDPSFLLSASGVFGAGVAAPAVISSIEEKHRLGSFSKMIIVPLCVNFVIFPASAMFFDEFSVISPISNLVLLPICEIILICGIAVTVTGGIGFVAVPVLKICGYLCGIVMGISEFIGNIRTLYIPLGSGIITAAVLLAVMIPISVYLICRKAYVAAYSAAAVLALSVIAVNLYRAFPTDDISVTVLKNGSAAAAVIHDRKTACVVDLCGGGDIAPITVKYLNRNGIYKINALIINSDANMAIPVYDEKFSLFDVSGYFIPEKYEAFSEDENVLYSRTSGIEMQGYEICFDENENVLINCGTADIILYPSEFTGNENEIYSAAVRYSGKKAVSDPKAEIFAALASGAEIGDADGRTVITEENVKFNIDGNGNVNAEAVY